MNTRPIGAELSAAAQNKDLYEIGEIPPLGHVPASMYAWVVRKDRHGPPEQSMQVEVVPTWTLDSHDVLVLVMAAGVNYNGVWAALGEPVSTARRPQEPLSHRRLRRVRHRLGGRLQGQAMEGRRRGRRSLQPGRRRRRGMQRRRPDVLRLAADLGLRDAGRLVRPVLPRAGPAADGPPKAPDLGGGGLLHADARHRLSHAVRPRAAPAEARRQRARLGRFGGLGRVRGPALRGGRRKRHRRHLRRNEARVRDVARRQGRHQPQGLSIAGANCRRSIRPSTTPTWRRRASSARRSGTSPRRRTSTRSSNIRASRPSRSRASS